MPISLVCDACDNHARTFDAWIIGTFDAPDLILCPTCVRATKVIADKHAQWESDFSDAWDNTRRALYEVHEAALAEAEKALAAQWKETEPPVLDLPAWVAAQKAKCTS